MATPQRVLNDPALESAFNAKGYVKVPFLSGGEIETLKKAFFDTIAQSGGAKTNNDVDFASQEEITYDFTFIDRNPEYKRQVFNIITGAFEKRTTELLAGYRPIIANFIRKKEGGGEVPMHQNWAFVDEEKYSSVSVWVPLVDSNEDNSTLEMVDGSHKKFGQHRGPMIPWEIRHLKNEIVSRHLTPMNVKAGEGVILDDSIVHYSNINKTPGLRLAIQLIMVPVNAPTIHYHYDREEDQDHINMLETDLEFYMNFHPWLKPKGYKVLKSIPYKETTYSYTDFLKALAGPRFDGLVQHSHLSYPALFKDKALQRTFEKDGYVKMQLLSQSEVKQLKDYYHSLNHDHIGSYGFHISLENKSQEYVNGVFNKLFSTFVPKLDLLLDHYKTFTASYVIKEAGLQNIVPPHQDWSFVDEREFCSATVWVPLMDVNKNNGALGVIPGSHRLLNYPRSSPSPQARSILSDHAFTLFPFVEIVDMKAGEALIFDNRLVHASPPNTSGISRIAAGIGITQKAAQLLHYYQVPGAEERIEVYAVDKTFFPRYNNSVMSRLFENGERPTELNCIKSYKKNLPRFSSEEMKSLITSLEGVKENTELMQELAGLYNYNPDGTPKQPAPKKEEVKIEVKSPVEEKIAEANAPVWVDSRTFFQKYKPSNIFAEIKHRLSR